VKQPFEIVLKNGKFPIENNANHKKLLTGLKGIMNLNTNIRPFFENGSELGVEIKIDSQNLVSYTSSV